ncbi:MAG: hydrogenase nickel incorporation protein HypB [Calditrichales bacterium]|nr:MAG: hydrogenase nickel incorporation protein HypB [Calditrichales bacterium]
MSVVTVERKILKKNDEVAAENRQLFKDNHVFAINLLSSPGSGKTSLLEKTLAMLNHAIRIAVIEGDVQTDNDARRVAIYNVPVVQIVTNGGCHLEAKLVQNALENIPLKDLQLLVIENVGNLVCPASYDLGEHKKVVMISTTEGDDKPSKYPSMFRVSNVMIINKTDLLAYVDFDMKKVRENALAINPNLEIIELSCRTGEGLDTWIDWIKKNI